MLQIQLLEIATQEITITINEVYWKIVKRNSYNMDDFFNGVFLDFYKNDVPLILGVTAEINTALIPFGNHGGNFYFIEDDDKLKEYSPFFWVDYV